ncbi:hypothetical protein F5888DRAFT_1698042 [Russula emetica]|nr:hypothetical protein F5888DRAFT_1698042 [Russula emetica]
MFSSLLVLSLAALAPLAHATVFITNPTASTNIPAGQSFTIAWQDDGNSPNLTAFGPATIGLYVGSPTVQTQLQLIANVDVSKVNSQAWTPDPSVGPNYGSYFIRFTSVSLKDPNQTQFNAEAFSAKFSLSGMTGTFNSTIQAEISGSTGPSVAASTAAATSGSGATKGPSGTSIAAASTVKPSAAASSAAGSSANNGAGHMVVPRVLGATGVAAIVFAFFV